MKFKNVLLVSDFDDTLVDRQKKLPERTAKALRYFTENGGYFTLASGRIVDAMRPQLKGLPINAPVICGNGTQIYDFSQEKIIATSTLPETAKADFQTILDAFPTSAVEIIVNGQTYYIRPNALTWWHLDLLGLHGIEATLDTVPHGWGCAKFEEETPVLQEMQTFIRANFPGRYEDFFSHKNLLEVANRGDNKGGGVLKLAKILGVDRKDIYCAGDNENDVSMLKAAHIGFCPTNATPVTMEAADQVVCDCDEGTMADIIEYLDKIYA